MARLPIPGQDENLWGTILNDFLNVSHTSSGDIQTSALQSAGGITSVNGKSATGGSVNLSANDLGAYALPGSGIPSSDLSASVQSSINNAVQIGGDIGGTATSPVVASLQGTNLNITNPTDAQVLTYSATNHQWFPNTTSTSIGDATDTSKGIIQLDGDLGGTASVPTTINTHLSAPLPTSQGGLGASSPSGVLKGNGASPVTGAASLSDLSTPTANFSMNGHAINSLADPTNTQDAATKHYVDTAAQGLSPKQSVQAATTAALPSNIYSNGSSGVGATLTATAHGALTVDGYTVNTNDRILVQNEAAAANNGIYIATSTGSAGTSYVLTRTSDFDLSSQVIGGYVFSNNGATNGNASFLCTTTGTVTFGTTAINWTQFSKISGLGTAASLNAGVANGVATLNGSALVPASQLPKKTFNYTQTWTIGGYVNLAQGDIDYINPIFVSVNSGQTLQLVGCRHVIADGTSVTVELQQNGTTISGYSSVSVTTTAASTTPTAVTLNDGDMLALVVTAISSNPSNLSLSLILQVSA